MKYWLKECPKCHGDLREESDIYGNYIACMQCGYTLTQQEEMRLITAGSTELTVPAQASKRAA